MAFSGTTSATTKLAINAALPTTYDATTFAALTNWTTVANVENMGELGGSTTVTKFIDINTGTVFKASGSVDYGQMQLSLSRHSGDDVDALREAFKDRLPRSFKIDYPAKIGGQNFFTGIVTSVKTSVGTADQITMMSVTIEIDNEVLEVE